MGVPVPEMNPAEEASAEGLLGYLRTISAPERRKHASVYNYWLSIRRDRQFPAIRDLDPLEISDAGPYSLLLEMIGGGEDAGIRHIGHSIKGGIDAAKVGDAPSPSLLSCIATRLPVVAACREAFAFEDEFETADGKTRCWVTLLPFSATGTWIDYVYGFVSLDPAPGATEAAEETAPPVEQEAAAPEPAEEAAEPEPVEQLPEPLEPEPESEPEPAPKPGFSGKFFEKLASVGGFYGRSVDMDMDAFEVVAAEESEEPVAQEPEEPAAQEPEEPAAQELEEPVAEEPVAEELVAEEPVAEEPVAEEVVAEEPVAEEADEPVAEEADEPVTEQLAPADEAEECISTSEGTLQTKLTDVRAKADEARQAKLRANAALYEGLSAAYDFALDAEDNPEEYLKLVQAEGLKIQLRSPMKPVAKLAFDGMCDDMTIKQLEAILAWAFDEELPRGTLAERIEEAGGIGPILSGQAKAA